LESLPQKKLREILSNCAPGLFGLYAQKPSQIKQEHTKLGAQLRSSQACGAFIILQHLWHLYNAWVLLCLFPLLAVPHPRSCLSRRPNLGRCPGSRPKDLPSFKAVSSSNLNVPGNLSSALKASPSTCRKPRGCSNVSRVPRAVITFALRAVVLRMQESGLAAMDVRLTCPLVLSRLSRPARGALCHHVECFDLSAFATFATHTGRWACPICSVPLSAGLGSLVVDEFVAHLLVSAGPVWKCSYHCPCRSRLLEQATNVLPLPPPSPHLPKHCLYVVLLRRAARIAFAGIGLACS